MCTALQGSKKSLWTHSLSNEWGRLAQGNDHGVQTTNTIECAHKFEVPDRRDITCATFVLDYQLLKSELHHIRMTVGSDRLTCLSDSGSPAAANMVETKLLINSTISDASKGTCFMLADLKDFFLTTPMAGEEHMQVRHKHVTDDIKK